MLRKLLFCGFIACAGTAYSDTKIVGGKIAVDGTWPSTMSLVNKELAEGIDRGEYVYSNTGNVIPADQANVLSHSCGGSLISSTWVLTAAHCVVDGETGAELGSDFYMVVSGTSDLQVGGLRTSIKRVVVHPSYNPLSDVSPEDADIALLELSSPISQTTLKLFTNHAAVGTNTTVTGWGLTEENGVGSRYLREVDLKTISNDQCKTSLREYLFSGSDTPSPSSSAAIAYVNDTLTDNMFCAGDGLGERDSCQGDSGGPLMALSNGEYGQLGIVSWGPGCARTGTYGVYTKVSNYFSWIRSVVSPGSGTTTPETTTPNDDSDTTGSSNTGTDSSDSSGSESSSNSGSSGGFASYYLLMVLGLAGVLRLQLRMASRRR